MTLKDYINSIKEKSISVIGCGISNRPLISLLNESGCNLTVRDAKATDSTEPFFEYLKNSGITFISGESYLDNLNESIIFRTPGLMPFNTALVNAADNGSIITSEMEVFFEVCPCKVIAITGSDGKTTTTTIISELLKKEGYTVHIGGNIGQPLLCAAPDFKEDDIAVVELSSFQLHSMKCCPEVAVVTNISPNHLDKHIDYQDYIDSKKNIFKNQKRGNKLILNYDNSITRSFANECISESVHFSTESVLKEGFFIEEGQLCRTVNGVKRTIINSDDIILPGIHNIQNFLAAFAAVSDYVSIETMRSVATEFKGVEHRLEHFCVKDGITYINDSIGSSPSRTVSGLHALKKKPVLIAGGYDKHIPFDELGDEINKCCKAVFLTGNTAEAIEKAIRSSEYYNNLSIYVIDDFDKCVLNASRFAAPGDIVLFSPACASFDRFKNFAERGAHFKKIILEEVHGIQP